MLIYLDLETTGLEQNDRLCSAGIILYQDTEVTTLYELIKPPKKISPAASAVHHITNEMIKDAQCFEDSQTKKILELYNYGDTIIVGHNVAFDLQMLQKEGYVFEGLVIDTLKCSRALMPECEQFSLQFLRYDLKLYKEELSLASELGIPLQAHHALCDALHVRLLHLYLNSLAEDEKLLHVSVNPVLIQKLNFGKYKGRYIEEIAMIDSAYLQWLTTQSSDEDLLYSIEYNLKML